MTSIPPHEPTPGGFQVGPGMRVTLGFRVFDEDGELVDESAPDAPLVAVFGFGQLLPRLERALDGRLAGDVCTAVLSPAEAFGRRDPSRVMPVDAEEFPADTQPGDVFEAENDEGALLVLRVLEVDEETVLLDTNHPLAGQEVRFELSVQAVRPASDEEIEAAVAALQQDDGGASSAGLEELLPADRLLRRVRQRN